MNATTRTEFQPAGATLDAGKRWLALYVLCLGDVLIVLDSTIVNVALPSIQADLGFSDATLAWVVNAYLLTFGGFLLLGGRLSDLFGRRRLFLIGLALFTATSLVCGVAGSQEFLVVARAVQGFGGAIVSVVALSLIMTIFTEPAERAKAMGIFSFVLSGGATAGVLLGGVLTDLFSWNWIFLVNLPVGITVFLLSLRLLPNDRPEAGERRLDLAGAVLVTAAVMLGTYAVINGNDNGWVSGETLGLLAVAAALFAVFLAVEARVSSPLMPLGLFRLRNVSVANVVGVMLAGSMFGWFFLSALYLQLVLGYSPLEVGLAYLPSTLIMAAGSITLSDRLVMRFGVRPPIVGGLTCFAIGLGWFARVPVDGSFVVDVLPGMLVMGIGGGITFNPLLLAAMGEVAPTESGLASGIVNTAFMMGGALGLAVLVSVADWRTERLRDSGDGLLAALTGGYNAAFLVAAVFAVSGALGALLLRAVAQPGQQMPEEEASAEAGPAWERSAA
ncbi:MAG TPA: DHA2 family efflux MFS transporter permease subunit [Thermoleophilaceae bacterium]|nr:DHA2 family efflux MFS transporter permease subunit [Thermoleophilaceae bacterium]